MAPALHRFATAALAAAVTDSGPKRRGGVGAIRAIAAGFLLGTAGRVAVRRGAELVREQPRAERSDHREPRPADAPSTAALDRPLSVPIENRRETSAGSEPGASRRTGDDAMTRSEEELRVRTIRRERGRVRVRKYVVTEEVQRTITLRREEVQIEEVPASEGGSGPTDADGRIVDQENDGEALEIVLHEEVPVIEKRVVPRERVRIVKATRRDEEEVVEEVRAERIEAEGDLEH